MRRRVHPILPALWLAVVSLGLAAFQATFAQAPTTPPLTAASDVEIQHLVQQGQQLEIERRWGEALSFYEEALRQHPQDRTLERGFQFARIHYDLGRRYNDTSFQQSLSTLNETDALALYAEVLLMIQSHHVDQPQWRSLVERGTTSLDVALTDPVFADRHLQGTRPELVAQLRRDLRAQLLARRIESRQEARDAVAVAAALAHQQLGLSPVSVVMEYTCGATNALDEYSAYLTADQLSEVYSQIEGNFVGLGVELKAEEGVLQIVRVIPGSPAERGGIRAGDQIVAVDGQQTGALSADAASSRLQGPEGSTVELSVVSPGQASRTLRIRRAQVEVPSIEEVKIVDADTGVGYLKLTCFQKTTSRDLDAALWKLHRQGMRSLIMDLRGNPGGLLTASVEVVDKFVERGTIVSTRGRNPQEDFNYSAHQAGTWRMPLVVLIDGDSASASEIFAGAIRDHRRGTIVGSRSYGKGSVQGIFSLNAAGAGIRLTTSKFYSPNGHPFSKVGVQPDITVQQVARPVDGTLVPVPQKNDDPVLNAGLQVARRQVAKR